MNFSATFLQKSKNSPFRTISRRENVKSAVDSLTLKSPSLLVLFSTLFVAADLLERVFPVFSPVRKKSLYIFKRWERRFYRAIFEKEKNLCYAQFYIYFNAFYSAICQHECRAFQRMRTDKIKKSDFIARNRT